MQGAFFICEQLAPHLSFYRILVVYMKKFILGCLLVTGMLATSAAVVQAQTIPPVDLNGFAWSSNIGWISLNCVNDGNCSSSDYKVTINADRTITGYGWSSNIGWIKFGGLPSGFPNTTYGSDAVVTGTYPNLVWQGWARACAATVGGDCSSMTTRTNSGGWDGWIALRGANHTVSANMTTGMNTNSYAWGSDVVGWVDMFSNVTFATPQASLIGTGCDIPLNASSCTGRLTWNIDSAIVSPNLFRLSPASQLSTSSAQNNFGVSIPFGNTTFHVRSGTTMLAARTLSAACVAGLTYNGTSCVVGSGTTSPAITMSVTPPFVRMGNTTRVQWSITPLAGSTCVINGPGLASVVATTSTGSLTTGPIRNAATVRMTCTGAYGSVEERVNIEVIPVAQEV
jgi:hypothetical protein